MFMINEQQLLKMKFGDETTQLNTENVIKGSQQKGLSIITKSLILK